jgi:transcriptional regulator with XRE-family HTH domain
MQEQAHEAYGTRMAEVRRELADELFAQDQNCVARLRMRAGLSQHKLARAAQITQPHLAKIEGGKLSIQLSTAVAIADALGVSLDELRPLVKIEKASTASTMIVGTL